MSKYNGNVTIGGVALSELTLDSNNRKKNATILKAGYTVAKRRFELLSFTAFVALEVAVLWRVISSLALARALWLLPFMLVLAEVVTDFVSGLSHWMCDTWGRLDTPIVGPTFIRSFREHHVDPTAMCSHDVIETCADASLFSVALNSYLFAVHGFNQSFFDQALYSFALFGGVFAVLTNQAHKWSHMTNPPAFVTFLQDYWIILPRKHHAVHHKPPFDKYYCITTGHLNAFLDGIGFWRNMETVITKVTGAKAREDDKLWTQQIYSQ